MTNIAIFNGAAGHLKRAVWSNKDTAAIAVSAVIYGFFCPTIIDRSAGHAQYAVHIDTAAVAIGQAALNRAAVHDEQAVLIYQYATASCSDVTSKRTTCQ